MSLNRHRARTDANHKSITQALKAAGVKFWYIKQPCDLLAAHKLDRRLLAIEIKADDKKPLTELQQELRIFLAPSSFYRVETIEQALSAVGAVE